MLPFIITGANYMDEKHSSIVVSIEFIQDWDNMFSKGTKIDYPSFSYDDAPLNLLILEAMKSYTGVIQPWQPPSEEQIVAQIKQDQLNMVQATLAEFADPNSVLRAELDTEYREKRQQAIVQLFSMQEQIEKSRVPIVIDSLPTVKTVEATVQPFSAVVHALNAT